MCSDQVKAAGIVREGVALGILEVWGNARVDMHDEAPGLFQRNRHLFATLTVLLLNPLPVKISNAKIKISKAIINKKSK